MTGPAQLVIRHLDGESQHQWPRSLLTPTPGDLIRFEPVDGPVIESVVTGIVHVLHEESGELTTTIRARRTGDNPRRPRPATLKPFEVLG